MELPPAASPSAPLFRRGPLTFADDGQSGAVNDEGQAGARAGAPKREGEMLTASRERGVIGGREIDAQHPEDRGQEALGLTQRYVEDETERQGGFDGEIGILELPAPPADASRCTRGDRVGREPESDVASPHEGSVVLGPVPDAIRCLVLRMHSRLHIEIMTRRRSRWSTCRPLLAHRAESAHQRRILGSPGFGYVREWILSNTRILASIELFGFISRRYERGSLVVTTNLPFARWSEVFLDATAAAAVIDRIVHHATVLTTNGDSYRLKAAQRNQTAHARQKKTR